MANQPIIIKRYKKSHHATHGGAWKIAYADFVTAMMAFFLLMWLINVASEETKKGIAEYFSTSVISMKEANAGSGMIEGEVSATQSGNNDEEIVTDNDNTYNSYNANIPQVKNEHTPEMQVFPDDFAASEMGDKDTNNKVTTLTNESDKLNVEHRVKRQGAIPEDVNVADLQRIDNKEHGKGASETEKIKESNKNNEKQSSGAIKQESSKKILEQEAAAKKAEEDKESAKTAAEMLQQKVAIQKVENNIKAAFNSIQEIEKFKHNLIIELTDEGIRIQIVDSPDHEMFKSGSPIPVKFTEKIIKALGGIVTKLPNKIEITGHTDSRPYNKKGYGNWELSSDRAHSTRRILEEGGVKGNRFTEVNGRADRDPFNKKDALAPENRRISITVLYDESQKQQQENTEKDSVNAKKTETKSAEKPQKSLNSQNSQTSRDTNQNQL